MQFTSISFEKLFPTGAYANEKIRAEMSLNPGEDAMEALQEARKLVNENFEKNNPRLVTPDIPIISKQKLGEYQTGKIVATDIPIIPKTSHYHSNDYTISTKEAIETMSISEQIESCKDLTTLKTYDFILKAHPEYKLNSSLRELYNQKLNELSK